MPAVVTLKLDPVGDRIRATLAIAAEQQPVEVEVSGWLPSPQEVSRAYDRWQQTYRQLATGSARIIARDAWDRAAANPSTRLQERGSQQARELAAALNRWLQAEAFAPLLAAWCDRLPEARAEARVIIRTESSELRRLPWHLWDLLAQYPNSEVALGALDFQAPPLPPKERGRVRILAILGYAADIDIEVDWSHLKAKFPAAEIVELRRPDRPQLEDPTLWDRAWDLLFFAGHSQTEAGTGRIFFNPDPTLPAAAQSLTLDELQPYLQLAVARGLQVAIFNSCDGLGLAEALEKLHIPQTIVMREPVPDRVAQQFLERFLHAYATEGSLYGAMRRAREHLQTFESQYPGASWLPAIVQNPALTPPSWLALSNAIPPCPYRGLAAFAETDAAVFFGREGEAETLAGRLERELFVAVVGASGSGKSSLVKAGLLPRLRRQGNWQIVQFRPGSDPPAALAATLAAVSGGDRDEIARAETRLALDLPQTDTALTKFLNGLPQQRLLLVADQFEEIYTLTTDPAARRALLANLLAALQDSPKLRLVTTIRADFLGAFYADVTFHRTLDRAKLNLYPMLPQAIERAIVGPALARGVRLEAGLVELLLADTGDREENLPLLQFALTQLWPRMVRGVLTCQAYRDIGGLRGALAQHAEAVYAGLTPEQREVARQLFGRLVRPGEGVADTRNVVARAELDDRAWQLATQLNAEANRLVAIGTDATGQTTIELAHEALIQAWRRLQQWLEADREFRIWQERLRSRQRQWQESDRDPTYLLRGAELAVATDWLQRREAELVGDRAFILASQGAAEVERRRGRRRRQLVLAVSVAIAVLTSGLAIVALRQTQQARQRETLAQLQTSREQALRLVAGDSELEALLQAVEMGRRAQALARRGQLPPVRRIQTTAVLFDILRNLREYARLEGHTDRIEIVAFRPDGQLLATGGRDGLVNLWSPAGELLQTFDHRPLDADAPPGVLNHDGQYDNPIGAIAFSPDGQLLATTSHSYTVKLWDPDGRLQHQLNVGTVPRDVRFGPNGQTLVTWGRDVRLWSASGRLLDTYTGSESIATLRFTDNQIVPPETAALVSWRWEEREGFATDPSGQVEVRVADTSVSLLRPRPGQALGLTAARGDRLAQAYPSPDGQVVTGVAGGRVRLWQPNGQPLQTAPANATLLGAGGFSPDGQILAIELAGRVALWHRDGQLVPLAAATAGSVAWSPDGDILALGSANAEIQLWSRDGRLLHVLSGHREEVLAIIFAPDSQSLIALDFDDLSFKVWSRDGQLSSEITSEWAFVRPQYTADGQTIVTADGAWTLTGEHLFHFTGDHKGFMETIALSPDGRVLAARARSDLGITLYNRDGSIRQTLPGAVDISFGPDNQIVAAAHRDRTVKLWDLESGRAIQTFAGQTGELSRVEFGPDGRALTASGSGAGMLLWSREGELLHQFRSDANFFRLHPDIETLLARACVWLDDYLQFDPSAPDRQALCPDKN